MNEKKYYVYILSSVSRTLYVGMTSNLERRMYEHKHKLIKGFTEKYNVNQLMYFEEFRLVFDAIEREKQIKSWRREKKLNLIETMNPLWRDLSDGWFEG
ncbi:MAG: GIY-YIG nuclease family protein [Ignavibacteriales bacterium]|nr:GIY-YIG nuclease family protein [Ignavibacteriales bacterium]